MASFAGAIPVEWRASPGVRSRARRRKMTDVAKVPHLLEGVKVEWKIMRHRVMEALPFGDE